MFWNGLFLLFKIISNEWNQVVRIRSIKAKTFKEALKYLVLRVLQSFFALKQLQKNRLSRGDSLPKAFAIDEYKGDTDIVTHPLIIANAETHEPIRYIA